MSSPFLNAAAPIARAAALAILLVSAGCTVPEPGTPGPDLAGGRTQAANVGGMPQPSGASSGGSDGSAPPVSAGPPAAAAEQRRLADQIEASRQRALRAERERATLPTADPTPAQARRAAVLADRITREQTRSESLLRRLDQLRAEPDQAAGPVKVASPATAQAAPERTSDDQVLARLSTLGPLATRGPASGGDGARGNCRELFAPMNWPRPGRTCP